MIASVMNALRYHIVPVYREINGHHQDKEAKAYNKIT